MSNLLVFRTVAGIVAAVGLAASVGLTALHGTFKTNFERYSRHIFYDGTNEVPNCHNYRIMNRYFFNAEINSRYTQKKSVSTPRLSSASSSPVAGHHSK